MLQRRRFFSNNKKDPKEDYVFVDGIEAEVDVKNGSYLELPIAWSENVTLEMTVTTPESVGTTSYICNLFDSSNAGVFEGPKVILSGKKPPYQKTISFVYNGTTYSEQKDDIPVNLKETVIKLTSNSLTIGSYVYNFEQTDPISSSNYIRIFGRSTYSSVQKGIIHNVKITTNSQIYNLLPCYHNNKPNVGVLYDEVRDKVYESNNPNYPFTPYGKSK